jgi:hypothetical protein
VAEGAPIEAALPGIGRVAFRQGSLRVFVSDLLYRGSPEPLLAALASAGGRGLLLAPYSRAEADPDWEGNIAFHDCESGRSRLQHVSPGDRARYAAAYARHFALWKDAARRHGARMARFAAEGEMHAAAQDEALAAGALEWIH